MINDTMSFIPAQFNSITRMGLYNAWGPWAKK